MEASGTPKTTLDQMGVQSILAPCSSKGNINNIQGLGRNAESWLPSRPTRIRVCVLTRFLEFWMHTKVWEALS